MVAAVSVFFLVTVLFTTLYLGLDPYENLGVLMLTGSTLLMLVLMVMVLLAIMGPGDEGTHA